MTEPPHTPSLLDFRQPRYWPLWLGLGLLRVLVLLPYRAQAWIGRALGRLGALLAPGRRAVVETNLRLCFPELGERERRALARRHFASLGIWIFDLAMAWWASDRRLAALARIEGLEHLERATAGGTGAILLSAHFPGFEVVGPEFRRLHPRIAGLYRPDRNPMVGELLRRARMRSLVDVIPKDNMRQMIRRLKQGVSVWYAPDQSYRRAYSVLIPFFGEPAMTNAALSHIARLSGAPVVPLFSRRLPHGRGYRVVVLPALENFPTGDLEADARRVMALIEEQIRAAPEQYYWVHRRFKGRPAEYPDPYR